MGKTGLVERWVADWRSSGVVEGDVLLVHSSISRTLKTAKTAGHPDAAPQDLLESLLAAVGRSGTLLLPLFNFDFPKGVPFDISTTPSQMGALTEAGRTFPGAVRTGHPIYSFAVIGARAGEFEGLVNLSGYGVDSPFAKLREMDGKIGVLDLTDQNSMTFYHHVEEMNEVGYRYFKTFTGQYTDATGVASERSFKLFVRNLEQGVLTDVNSMGELLWSLGLYKGFRPGESSGLRTIRARDLYEATSTVILEGRALGMLYSVSR